MQGKLYRGVFREVFEVEGEISDCETQMLSTKVMQKKQNTAGTLSLRWACGGTKWKDKKRRKYGKS